MMVQIKYSSVNFQITSVVNELQIEILPEGSLVHRHTSLLLDLRNRAHVLRFLNIVVDETPIVPYEVQIYDSSLSLRNFGIFFEGKSRGPLWTIIEN
jgi:hypothetical protein